MQSRWVRRIAYVLLAAVVVVTSCQAMAGLPAAAGSAGLPTASHAVSEDVR